MIRRRSTARVGTALGVVLVSTSAAFLSAPAGTSAPTTPPTQAVPAVAVAAAEPVPAGTVQVGSQQRALDRTDAYRGADLLVRYTPAWGASTRTNQYGFEAAVVDGQVTRVQDGVGDLTIPAGGYVLSGHGTARSWLRATAVVGARVWLAGEVPGGAQEPPPPGAVPEGQVQVGSQQRALDRTDAYRATDLLVRYTPAWGATTRTNAYGVEAAVVDGRVTRVEDGVGNTAIPPGGYVLSGHGAARSWLRTHAVVGAEVRLAGEVPGGGTTEPPPPVSEELPDLRMRTLTGITLDTTQTPGVKRLEFPTVISNVGAGPLHIVATRSSSTSTDWVGTQYVTRSDGTTRPLTTSSQYYFGGDGHHHWHVRDLNRMEILNANGVRQRLAEKHGFCFEDNTGYRDWPSSGQNGAPARPAYTAPEACGSGDTVATRVLFGISVGWGDTYPATLPDQFIDVTGLPNGRYRVRAVADQGSWFQESDETNNASWADIKINGDAVEVLATGGGA